MGRRHRVACVAGWAVVAVLGGGCKKPPPPPPPAPAPAASAPPPDRLANGEIAPGMVKAFDLALPRGSVIERTFGATVYARVPMSPEATATFVAGQAEEEAAAVIGPTGTVIARMRVRDGSSGKALRVEIHGPRNSPDAQVIVDQLGDPQPPEPKLPTAEALKKVGKAPDGKWLDPTKLE